MDTGTHIVMGLALGGLATLDPAVATSSVTATSVMIGTIIGSQAPDIDTVLKLKNNAIYLRNHRGITHSIPAVFLWPIGITICLAFLFPEANIFHVWLWTFLAVFLHVFVDIFNGYGTQALRPFSSKWLALGIINTFDPYIFSIHIMGIIIWAFGAHPGFTFLVIYGILVVYYIIRFLAQRQVLNKVKELIPNATNIIITPTMKFHKWRLAIMTEEFFYVGQAVGKEVTIIEQFQRVKLPKSPVIEAAKKDKNVAAFLSFSPVYRWEIDEFDDYYEVRFIDLRYRSKDHYPFVAVAQLHKDLSIRSSYTGWIFSEEKLRKKLAFIPN